MVDSVLQGYISETELARQLKTTPRTLQRWRTQRKGPPAVQVGRLWYYCIESFRAWLAQREMKMVREKTHRAA
jgi:Helix-turn-helix domain